MYVCLCPSLMHLSTTHLSMNTPVFGVLGVWTHRYPQHDTLHNFTPVLQRRPHLFSYTAHQWQSLHVNLSLSNAKPRVFKQCILEMKLLGRLFENLQGQALEGANRIS